MKNNTKKLEVNFYFIKSEFKEILIRLCKKILNENKRVLINLKNESDLVETDNYLWTKEKDSFIPHQTFNNSLSDLDNLVLFEGSYERVENFKKFKRIIVSPGVEVSKFKIFEHFMLFSNNTLTKDLLRNIKNKLFENKIKHKIFYEYESFKWKVVN